MLDERLAGRDSVAAWDPLRLSVDVRGTGATGHRIAELMRERDDVILELFSENVVVAVFGIGERAEPGAERLVEALRHAVEAIGPADVEDRRSFAEPPPWGPLELAPRDAFLGAQEVVPFDEAEGRIAAESLAAYPPGVPNVLPGERLTAPTLAYIADSLAHGGLVRGASDRSPEDDQGGDRVSEPERWGVDSEHGRLLDVLLCPPDNYRWGPTSAISKATLESGRSFDAEAAATQHARDGRGLRVGRRHAATWLEPDPVLPYQVFARDSSTMGPNGVFVTQLSQSWRRGEYAPVIRFYQEADIPIRGMITAGSLEGGDVVILEPGTVLIGNGETRTQEAAARQLAGWFEEDGWEARIEPIPERYVHIDVLVSVLADKVAAVCTEVIAGPTVEWLRAKGFEIIEVSAEQAFTLGVNAISLGEERVLSAAAATELNEALRSLGLTVHDPDLSMFTLGGGGAHCLAQPLRRERLAA